MANAETGANNYAIFPQTPKTAYAVTTGANTILTDAPNNTVLLLTAGAKGAEVTGLTVIPRATCTATVAYLFLSKDSGATQRMIHAKTISADTVSPTDLPTRIDFGFSEGAPLRLEAGDRLYVGTSVALPDGFAWVAQQMDY